MENILDDKNLIFHGIGYNIFSLIGILRYGICSNSKSKELGNPFFVLIQLAVMGIIIYVQQYRLLLMG